MGRRQEEVCSLEAPGDWNRSGHGIREQVRGTRKSPAGAMEAKIATGKRGGGTAGLGREASFGEGFNLWLEPDSPAPQPFDVTSDFLQNDSRTYGRVM